MVELLDVLVVRAHCIGSKIHHVGWVLRSKFWLVRPAGDLTQVLHGQLKIFHIRTLKDSTLPACEVDQKYYALKNSSPFENTVDTGH